MAFRLLLASLVALAAALGAASAAPAQDFDPRSRYSADEARDAREAGDILPAREIVRRVRRLYPRSDILDVDLIRDREAGELYRVRILDEGRRRDVWLDARTGALRPAPQPDRRD